MYRWDFGDGTATEWSPTTPASHAYTVQGAFTVTFTVRDDDNDTGTASTIVRITDILPTAEILGGDQTVEEDQPVDFQGEGADSPSDQAILQYRWNFGDGNRSDWSSEPDAQHAYPGAGAYTVTLSVRDDENATASSDPVYIDVENIPPVASASASPKSIDEDGTVRFSASGSTDTPSDLPTLSFHWSFGDSQEDDGMNVSHTYTKSGTYTVRLRVTDDNGAYAEDSSIRIKVRNVPPSARAFANPASAKVNERIGFTGEGNDTPSDLPLLRYIWYFGDGQTAQGANATHQYAEAGKYTARLEVTDPDWERATAEVTVDIGAARKPAPAAPGPDYALRAGIATAIIIAVAAVSVLVMRRRPRRPA